MSNTAALALERFPGGRRRAAAGKATRLAESFAGHFWTIAPALRDAVAPPAQMPARPFQVSVQDGAMRSREPFVVGRRPDVNGTAGSAEPALKQIELVNYELSGYSKVSNTMLADSAIGLEAILYQLFGRAIAWYED